MAGKDGAIIQLRTASILHVTASKKTLPWLPNFELKKESALSQMLCQLCFLVQAPATPPTLRLHATPTLIQAVSELVEKYQSQWKRKEWHTRRGEI